MKTPKLPCPFLLKVSCFYSFKFSINDNVIKVLSLNLHYMSCNLKVKNNTLSIITQLLGHRLSFFSVFINLLVIIDRSKILRLLYVQKNREHESRESFLRARGTFYNLSPE